MKIQYELSNTANSTTLFLPVTLTLFLSLSLPLPYLPAAAASSSSRIFLSAFFFLSASFLAADLAGIRRELGKRVGDERRVRGGGMR
jgi:hypothetical protein